MKTNNKTTKAVETMGAGLLAVAMGVALALTGCSTGGGSSNAASTATWPSATPPPTSQTNTYLGTQSPGLYTITIDHTNNSFSYQDLSTSGAAISGSFTTTANGFLALSTSAGSAGYALEQLSRAVLLVPPLIYNSTGQALLPANAPIFAVASPSCQVISSRAKFAYLATANPNYGFINGSQESTNERTIASGQISASTDTSGANWNFGGDTQYFPPSSANGTPTAFSPIPDSFAATCAAGSGTGSSLVQSAVNYPSDVPANLVIGPTGFFVEDRYQGDGVAFVGAVQPPSPVDLSQLSGATFLGVNAGGGAGSTNANPAMTLSQLVSFSATAGGSGTSLILTGGSFPKNDPTQTPATNVTLNLGAQDPANNGYFPSFAIGSTPAFALVSNAGGKYTLFVFYASGGGSGSFILFQQ